MAKELSAADLLQKRVIDGTEDSLLKGRDVAVDAPTGSGKSRIFSKIAENGWRKGERTLILSSRKKLTKQAIENVEKYAHEGIKTSICLDGKMDQSGTVVSATVQTINRNIDRLENYDRVIIDEAHHALKKNSDYENIIRTMSDRNPMTRFVGVSATFPENMEGMTDRLEKADKQIITFEEAIEAKLIYLPKTEVISPTLKNHGKINDIVQKMKKNDLNFDMDGIGAAVRKNLPENFIEEMASVYSRKLGSKRTLSFFDKIDDALTFEKHLKEDGIKVATVHSRQSYEKNKQIFEDFDNGKIQGIVSVDMISEGYDVKTDALFLGKMTTSNKEYRQIVGRAARGYGEDKEDLGLLIDMGASTHMHGEISNQATVANIAKKIETTENSTINALPEGDKNQTLWKQIDPNIWATYLGDRIVYAARKDGNYQVVQSVRGKNSRGLTRLEIEGEPKGRLVSREGFGKWCGNKIREVQRELSTLMTRDGGLDKLINTDWERNRNLVLMMLEPQRQMAMINQRGIAH